MEILDLAIHDLDLLANRQGGIKASQNLINIPNTPDGLQVKKYIETHVSQSLNSNRTIPAKFVGVQNNVVLSSLRNCFTDSQGNTGNILDESIFLTESINITNRIKNFLSSTSSKSDALIMFVYYQDDYFNKNIAILKLDPKNGFTVNQNFDISVLKNVLPDENSKLHKIAIIKVVEHNTAVDTFSDNPTLFVLDRQNTKTNENSFFMDKVLNASSLATSSGMTEYVYNNASEFLINSGYVNETDRITIQDKVKHYLVNNPTFSLDLNLFNVVQDYILTDDLRDLDRFSHDISQPLLEKIRTEKYSDATMTFTSDAKSIKPIKLNNDSNSVTISIANTVDSEDYSVEPDENEQDTVIIKLRNGLGDGILN
ncbi:Putative uncharacterized protein [Leuconostoc citreum LBAE E16]|uniref:hypothetical protein n=1 Tax=Leuconostoc citreum TaxID=33964 RepID=UPI00024657FD|nr:hypothetical protein [Leuconostoc citreum]CCF28392.1 Putative uncharacterized protein [Leuconostoc citreum LBAE E16]